MCFATPPRKPLAVLLVSVFLRSLAFAQLSANSGINSADTWAAFDLTVQGNRTLSEPSPFYDAATGQTSDTVSLAFSRGYHVEMGYDSGGGLVVNMWPTGPAPAPGADAPEISMIRLAGGQVTVFDEDGNPIAYVAPNASAPLPAPLQYLGSNPGPSVLRGLVIPEDSLPGYAASVGGTVYGPPDQDCASPCYGNAHGESGEVEMAARWRPRTGARCTGGTTSWPGTT